MEPVEKRKLEKSYRTLLLKEQTLHASFHRRPTHRSGKINVPIIRNLASHEYLVNLYLHNYFESIP